LNSQSLAAFRILNLHANCFDLVDPRGAGVPGAAPPAGLETVRKKEIGVQISNTSNSSAALQALQALFNTQQSGGVAPADNALGSGQILPTTGASSTGAASSSPTAQQGPAGQFGAQALNFLLSLQDQAGGAGAATSTSSAAAGPISLVQELDTLASALKQLGEALEGAGSTPNASTSLTSSAPVAVIADSGSTASVAPTALAAANSIFIQTLNEIGSTLQTLLQTQPGSGSHHHHHHHPEVQNASTGASTTSGATSGASTVTANGASTGSSTTTSDG
jgi:hypothetical protein